MRSSTVAERAVRLAVLPRSSRRWPDRCRAARRGRPPSRCSGRSWRRLRRAPPPAAPPGPGGRPAGRRGARRRLVLRRRRRAARRRRATRARFSDDSAALPSEAPGRSHRVVGPAAASPGGTRRAVRTAPTTWTTTSGARVALAGTVARAPCASRPHRPTRVRAAARSRAQRRAPTAAAAHTSAAATRTAAAPSAGAVRADSPARTASSSSRARIPDSTRPLPHLGGGAASNESCQLRRATLAGSLPDPHLPAPRRAALSPRRCSRACPGTTTTLRTVLPSRCAATFAEAERALAQLVLGRCRPGR